MSRNLTSASAIRAIGALLLGAGLILVFVRRSASAAGDPWGDIPLFLVLALGVGLLYGLAMMTAPESEQTSGEDRSWLTVSLVFGALMIPLALGQGLLVIDDDPGVGLNVFWIFALSAAAAYIAWQKHGARIMVLLTGAFVLTSWLGLWNEILSDGLNDTNGVRIVLLVLGAGLVAAGFGLPGAKPGAEPRDLVTIGGLALIAGCVADRTLATSLVGFGGASVSTFWTGALLVVSLGLLVLATRGPIRGPGYVGALGLITFLVIAGLQLSEAGGADRTGSLMGWPLILLVVGVGSLAYAGRGAQR